jgi:tRNA/rRNA methyltransferase
MKISFILVEPAVPENIGASARAIKTMGFKDLCLVGTAAIHLDKKSKILAHGSADVLENAKVFIDFDHMASEFDFLIATSAKRRRTNENYIQAEALLDFVQQRESNLNRIGIVFGREESGLTNDEIRKCDLVTYVPIANPYPSLNLSQAVMIYAYLLSRVLKVEPEPESESDLDKISFDESISALKGKVKSLLKEIEIKQPHVIGPRIMERLSYLEKEDISLLHSTCNSLLEKIKR